MSISKSDTFFYTVIEGKEGHNLRSTSIIDAFILLLHNIPPKQLKQISFAVDSRVLRYLIEAYIKD